MIEISVIVPVYNVEKYLSRCIDSILNQTFTDFELILVDDGSTDNSGKICDKYAKADARVKVIHQDNHGQAAARNYAIKKSKGAWIHFVDSDDFIHPQILEILYHAVKDNNVKISMCRAVEVEEEIGDFKYFDAVSFGTYAVDDNFLKQLFLCGEYCYGVVVGKLIDKSIIEKIPFTDRRIYEDSAVMCQWLYEAGTVADSDAKLYFYFKNPLGTTKSKFSIKQLDILWSFEEQEKFYKNIHFSKMESVVLSRYIISSAKCYRETIKVLHKPKVARIIRNKLRKKYFLNRKKIIILDQDKRYILEMLYPKAMDMYWLFIALKNKIKKGAEKK